MPKLTKLDDVMDVQATVADPQFKKIGRGSYSDAERKIAWGLRVPPEVQFLLMLYLTITAGLVGHQIDGPRGRRARIREAATALY